MRLQNASRKRLFTVQRLRGILDEGGSAGPQLLLGNAGQFAVTIHATPQEIFLVVDDAPHLSPRLGCVCKHMMLATEVEIERLGVFALEALTD